ncbi:hypothetical protein GMSM_18250 [Geomonas sp. Red276]
MEMTTTGYPYIKKLTPEHEKAIWRMPLLNIDSLLIPSPYILDKALDLDYDHSLVWEEKGELLGYLLVYATPDRKKFHLYRQVTSPFGRGKGIGTSLAGHLADSVPPDAQIYLFVWDKLISSIDFFRSKGFTIDETIVFRKMKFHRMSITAGTLRVTAASAKRPETSANEELSKVRHDVKKSLRVLFDMASMLSVDNFNKMAEDITRESTALVNTLNTYEDSVHLSHKVSLKELITERVIPYVEAVDNGCEVRFTLKGKVEPVSGSYSAFSRALINIVSNAVDAIKTTGRKGLIEFTLEQQEDTVTLAITDNGTGIEKKRLELGPDRVPLFVGKTTKENGEGIGTIQVFSTFGADRIQVESAADEFTRWTISLRANRSKESMLLTDLWSKYIRFIKSTRKIGIGKESSRTEISAFIWQLRQMELFSFDLIYHFSTHNNIRDIYRGILHYRTGTHSFDLLKEELKACRIEHPQIRSWLLGITRRIARNEAFLREQVPCDQYRDVLFQSYGQAIGRTMVFTLDPETGNFFTADRRLVEHVDFLPYLGKDRDELLRGELIGDVRNVGSPIYLGVWSVKDEEDLHRKLKLIRKGARRLLEMGLAKEKSMAFYNTTYNSCESELDTFKSVTLGEMAALEEADFPRFIRRADNELSGLIFAN